MNGRENQEQLIFEEAAQIASEAERAAYLDQACGGDPMLRARLEVLLEGHFKGQGFLDRVSERGAEMARTVRVSAPEAEEVGTAIGRYKLLEKVGEGGFGAVYAAEQREPVKRRVALKLIKLGMDTKQVIARFEAERQALALMDHPNIAKVLDGGATETGRPYFVMELVRGRRITEYCDQENLSTKERLGLLIQVCHAIQHAHQKGIIHRDIKPSNILVTVVDGRPVPKVIDFGIAKATQGGLTDKTVYTQLHQFIGTPAYMSPEQTVLSGVDVDTRSDIYSLGVLLYELLTAHTPFDPKTLLAGGLDEMRRMIREQPPPRPSTRISTLDETERTTVAKHRQAEPGALSRLMRGDLDWIVMKCLEKDRGRRYATVNGLAQDIEHHLNQEPVTAAAPSALYQAGKFVRRHTAGLAMAAALVLLLAAGGAVSVWQAVRATRAERSQSQLRQRAEAEKARADAAREQVEVRGYASDMSLAAHSAGIGENLGTAQNLLARWRHSQPDRRGWEWYFLNGLCHRELRTIEAHTNNVQCVAWSPDGRRLASAGRDGAVRLWDPETGHKLAELPGHTDMVHCVAWSPNGRQLATASSDRTVRVWDATTYSTVLTLAGHKDDVFSVAWSRDGKRLASTSQEGTLKIWDAATGAEVLTGPVPQRPMTVSWSMDDSRLAVGSEEASTVLDAVTGRRLFSHDDGRTVSWSPDGKWLATGGWEYVVKIMDAVRGTNIIVVGRHVGLVMCVAWSPDGSRLASTSKGEGAVKIWDSQRGAEVQVFRGHKAGVRSVTWRPDGKQVASGGLDGTIRIWDMSSGYADVVTTKIQPVLGYRLAWNPDGRRLATGGSDGAVRIWDTASAGEPTVLHGHTAMVRGLSWNPAGTRLAAGGSGGLIKVWETSNAKELWSVQVDDGVPNDPNRVQGLAWSPDGTRLASVASDYHLKIRDGATGALLAMFDLRGVAGLALAWSPDGKQLAVGCGSVRQVGSEIEILDATTGNLVRALRGHRDQIRSLAWSRDSRRLASASEDTTVRVWETTTGREIHTLWGHSSMAGSVAWSPDQTRLASGSWDGTVKIWDPTTGEEVCSFAQSVNPGSVVAVAWSPDGTRIASSGGGGRILIRDSTPGRVAEDRLKQAEFEQSEAGRHPAMPPR